MVSWRINSNKFSNNIKLNKMEKINEQAETLICLTSRENELSS